VALVTARATGRRAAVAWLAIALALVAAGAVAWSARSGHEARGRPETGTAALRATPATLKRVFAAAPDGATILLAPGDYGSFTAGVKRSPVTIRPAPGASARMSLAFSDAANVRLEGLRIAGADIGGRSRDVTIARSTFTDQVVIRAEQMSAAGIVLDGNRLAHIDACAKCYEGRVQILGDSGRPSGIVIANNVFGPGGASDGIQDGGNGVRIVGNTFVGIVARPGGRHIDALQLYGQRNTVIRGNYFRDVPTAIMAPDGADHELIEHNVFDTGSYPYAIMLGGDDGSVIRRNTLADLGGCAYDLPCGTLLIADGPSHRAGRGTVVQDNILGALSVGGASTLGRDDGNLVAGGGGGAGDRTGSPSFAGGAHPTSRSGFRLAGGSPGSKAASYGADVGIAHRAGR
jgi:Right handed beta helix region